MGIESMMTDKVVWLTDRDMDALCCAVRFAITEQARYEGNLLGRKEDSDLLKHWRILLKVIEEEGRQ